MQIEARGGNGRRLLYFSVSTPFHSTRSHCYLHIRQQRALHPRADRDHPKLVLVQHEKLAWPRETKIRGTSWYLHFAEQFATRTPYIHPIAAATVDVPLQVAFDAIRYA